MSVLRRSLDLENPDVMLWAACCFGFLRGGGFTVNSPFDPSLHLTLADIQVDVPLNPRSVQTLSERAASSFLVVVPSPVFVLWFPW